MKSPGVLPIIAIITLSMAGTAAAQEPSQSPRVLTDVVGQFNALTQRPDAMGFELYGPDPGQCQHMQAVVRVDAPDGTPYLLVTRSGITSDTCPGRASDKANMYIVKMGTRDKDGERMRSNRLRRNTETTHTAPDTADRVVRAILFDGTTEWPHYGHPGGMQLVGDILVLALEAGESGQPPTKILFLDVRDPENPVMLPRPFIPESDKAGVVAITPCGSGRELLPCATGHFLMMITGGHNEELRFFESTTDKLTSKDLDWDLLYTWHKDELIGSSWPDSHQTLHFLRQSDGRLFLAGARAEGTVEGYFGDDYVDLYEVGINGSKIELTQRSTRHMISHPTGEGIYDPSRQEVLYGGRLASFAAASGFHITPKGELLFYATEHDNDGPEGTNGRGSVKMGEWRHIDLFRPGSPAYLPNLTAPDAVTVDEGSSIAVSAAAAPPIAKAWIELFEDFGYGGRFVVVEHPDWFKDNFDDFGALDRGFLFDPVRFDNRAASWRWFAPGSCNMRANEHSFDDSSFPGTRSRTLSGTGVRQSDRNLKDVAPDSGSGDMFQVVSSIQFSDSCSAYYSTPLVVRWDLDFDGAKETTAGTVTLSAARLDGPSDRALAIDTRHPADGLTATKDIVIHVRNVNPVVGSWALLDAAGRRIGVDVPFALQNRPVSGVATFTDQGRLDHQTAAVEWGDGTTTRTFSDFADAFDGATGRLTAKHAYSVPGAYNARVAVTDDDLGTGTSDAAVRVVSPADAVKQAIALLDALIATAPDSARVSLAAARAALAGAGKSGEASGALEKIDRELVSAAAARLRVASRQLDRASDLVDLAIIQAIVDEVAAAIAM
jgi:hypothetical protein